MQKCKVGPPDEEVNVFIITGEYDDGTLGELSVELEKEGTILRCLMSCFCQAVSLGLQHGVPLDKFVRAFTFTRFEPAGSVRGHPHLKNCTSIIDLVFRHVAINYLGQEELAHVTPPKSAD